MSPKAIRHAVKRKLSHEPCVPECSFVVSLVQPYLQMKKGKEVDSDKEKLLKQV